MATSLQLPSDVESMSAREILRFCLDSFPGNVSLACSFQKEESVLLDMLFELEPKARVFAIDTHYLFPETYELWKASPLADWSDDDSWSYIRERGLPYNPLHDRGYASIGDTHSTIPGAGREGRWAGTGRTECGLHVEEA